VPMEAPPAHAAGATSPELAIVREINDQRRARGLGRLDVMNRLGSVARAHTRDMLRHDNFSHDSADGTPFSRRLSRAGFRRAGETIAWMSATADCGASAVVRYWLESPPHARQLMARRYHRIGIGRLSGAMGSQRGVAVTADLA
jgi:uncharacterized protein YkwD